MSQIYPFATAFGLALVHSLWIGALLYALVRTLLPLLPGPAARHHLAYGSLWLLAAGFGYTFVSLYEPNAPECENLIATSLALDLLPPAADASSGGWLAWLRVQLPVWAPWLSFGYCLGFFPAVILLIRQQQRVHALSTQGLAPLPVAWVERLGDELERHPATRRVRCFLSARAGEAMTLGFWRPVVVLPVALVNQLTPAMAHTILMHEIAHLRHYDHWLNYPQQIIRTFFFFHPAAHALCRLIDREREHRCDDWVAARCADRRTYATALVTVARASHTPQLQLTMSATKTPFTSRIQRLFNGDQRRRESRFAFSVLFIALLGLGHLGYFALGEDAGAVNCLEEQSKAQHATVEALWGEVLANQARLQHPTDDADAPKHRPCPTQVSTADFPFVAAPEPPASHNERVLERYDDARKKYETIQLRTRVRAQLLEELLPKQPCSAATEAAAPPVDPLASTLHPLQLDTTPPASGEPFRMSIREGNLLANRKLAVFINGKFTKSAQLGLLELGTIQSINVVKDAEELKALGLTDYEGLVRVTTK